MGDTKKAKGKSANRQTAPEKHGNRTEKQTKAKNSFRLTEKQRSIIFAAVTAVAVAAAVLGAGYFITAKSPNSIRTDTVLYDEVVNAVTVKMFVVRDEECVSVNGAGKFVAAVEDGARVGVGNPVVYSFADDSSAVNEKQLQKVNEELDYYNGLVNSDMSSSAIDVKPLKNGIVSSLYDFLDTVSNGDMTDYDKASTKLRDTMTSVQLTTGVRINVEDKIAELTAQRDELLKNTSSYKTVNAPHSGYYISGSDGYESVLAFGKVDEWTVDDVNTAIASKRDPDPKVIGRIAHSFTWYLTCVVSSEQAASLEVGDDITVAFPYSTADKVETELYRITADGKGNTLLVFKCRLMDESLTSLRCETAQIYISEYEGFKIRNDAIREVDGSEGVYIIKGKVVRFRKINTVYSSDDYSIVTFPEKTDYYESHGDEYIALCSEYVHLYDTYIIGGTDVHVGNYVG